MNILEPDEANFDRLIQLDKNIQNHIKNMNRILSNSIEILILDSLERAINIHSQLSYLNFPISQWISYIPIHQEKLLKILSNTPSENLPMLIDNIVNVRTSKLNPNKNPFVLSFFLNKEAQSIIEKKYNYSEFQNILLTKFIKKLPTYQGFHNTFAFAELFKIDSFILPENKSIYNQLSKEHLENFFFKAFKNDMVYSVFDRNESFFNYFSIDIVKYLQSNNNNPVIEKFIEQCFTIDPFNNTKFPTLLPEEINIIKKLKIQHDFLVLNSKIPEKNIKYKSSKI
jgi:hypothetical protein